MSFESSCASASILINSGSRSPTQESYRRSLAKLPGLGDVDWAAVFAALSDAGYRGAVCIEVEDRAYEGSLEDRKRALRQSKRYLEQFTA